MKPSGPKSPAASVATPYTAHEATTLSARFAKPPVAAKSMLPAIMPTENTTSARAAAAGVPAKWPSVIMGKSADMGENTSVKADPHHSRAKSPRYLRSTR